MIKCHLSRVMGEHKMKVIDVSRKTGLHRNSITLLYKETATRIDFDVLNKLCTLFKCQVSDLFEWVDDKNEKQEK